MIEAKNVSFPFVLSSYATFKQNGEYGTLQLLHPVTSRTVWHSLFGDFVAGLIVAQLPEKYGVKDLKSEGMLRFSFAIVDQYGNKSGWGRATVWAEDALLAAMASLEDKMQKFVESRTNANKGR